MELEAHIAWMGVWNRQLNTSTSTEEHDDDYGDTDPAVEAAKEQDRAGVLYAASRDDDNTSNTDTATWTAQHRLAQRIGLAQGLVDFTRSFADTRRSRKSTDEGADAEGDADPPNQRIKVVQSQNQRLVFLQPEPGYWIVAAFDRYQHQRSNTPTDPSSHARDSSAATVVPDKQQSASKSTTSATTPASPRKAGKREAQKLYPSSFLANEVLIACLTHAYTEYALFNGSFKHILELGGLAAVKSKLKTFFDAWMPRAKLLPLGLPEAPFSQDPAVLSIFRQHSPQGYAVVASHRSGLLCLPALSSGHENATPLSPAASLALSTHLANLLPIPSTSALAINTDKRDATLKASKKDKRLRKQASMSQASWKNLGLGGITNYLPSMPGISASTSTSANDKDATSAATLQGSDSVSKAGSASTPAAQTVGTANLTGTGSNSHGKRSASGPAWLPSFSLFSSSSSSSSSGNSTSNDTAPSSTLAPHVRKRLVHIQTASDMSHASIEDPPLSTLTVSDIAPSEASVEALSIAISEDLPPLFSAGPDAGASTTNPSVPETAAHEDKVPSLGFYKWHAPCNVFDERTSRWRRCYFVSTDTTALALVATDEAVHTGDDAGEGDNELSQVTISATERMLARLEESILSLSATQTGPSKFYGWKEPGDPSIGTRVVDNRASSSAATSAQRLHLASNAQTDVSKLFMPGTNELFIRNALSQWLIAKPVPSFPDKQSLTILPRSVGKEGSLVDADLEVQAQGSKTVAARG